MTHLLDTLIGLVVIAGLLVRTRGRTDHPYWRWRRETAIGSGPPPTSNARAVLHYARWIGRMRRLR
jgi:hypothetical protein